jgi:hypothetical protein
MAFSEQARKSAALARSIKRLLGDAAYLNYKRTGSYDSAALDAARRGGVPTAPPEEIAHPEMPEPTVLSGADDLAHALTSGYTVVSEIHGGNSNLGIQKIQFPDGQHAALKTTPSPEEARREILANRVANVLGVTDIYTAPGQSDHQVVSGFIEGRSGNRVLTDAIVAAGAQGGLGQSSQAKRRRAIADEEKRVAQLPNGREIGILDWLTPNPDRHAGNWFVTSEDRVVPIDHGKAFLPPARYFDPNTQKNAEMVPDSPFSTYWTGFRLTRYGEVTVDTDPDGKALQITSRGRPKVSKAYLANVRLALESIRHEFTESHTDFPTHAQAAASGSPDPIETPEQAWFDQMMDRLRLLEQAAPARITDEPPFRGGMSSR